MKSTATVILSLFLFSIAFNACKKEDLKNQSSLSNSGTQLEDYSPCLLSEEIDTAQLPQLSIDFLEDQYPGISVLSVEIVGDEEFYRVQLANDDLTEILFNSFGQFTYSQSGNLTSNELGEIPSNINDHISSNYSESIIDDSCSFSDFGTLYINIGIEPGGSLLYDTESNFLCEYDYDCAGNINEEEESNICPRQKGYWKTHRR